MAAATEPVAAPNAAAAAAPLETRVLSAYFGDRAAIRDITIDFPDQHVTAIIGPSGCGKSTLLRCLNRMHETIVGAHITGQVCMNGEDIYGHGVSATGVRRHIGMVFQRPTPFPTMSIADNASAGLNVHGRRKPDRARTAEIVELALRRTALWDEVKDRLRTSAVALSGGQQQRLCIARALATEPRILLLDEPTASLDPLSTQKIEELLHELRASMTIVIVTHNMQQAARVSGHTAFLLGGILVEVSPTERLFTAPSDTRTEDYITGRFG